MAAPSNTPTPAQAFGEGERLARELDEFADNYGATHLLIEDARAAAAALRQHGQHFAGLEARLNDAQNAWCVQATELRERAEAAEARCSELEAECADLRKRHHGTLIAWEAEITNSGYAESRCAELEGGCQMLREEVEGLRAAFLAAKGERHE